MSLRSLSVAAGLSSVLLCTLPAPAQTTSRFTFNAGGGFTEPIGANGRRLNTGFNLGVGGGINLSPHVGVIAEFGFNGMNLSDGALARAQVPDGSARIYSVTLNPIVHFNPRGRMDAYLVGGGGFYRRTVEFTQPTVDVVPAFDPFYGAFFPVAVPANIILGSFTQNKGGLNIGAGVTFRVRGDSNAKFFAESRYHFMYTTPARTTYMPVTFGFRW